LSSSVCCIAVAYNDTIKKLLTNLPAFPSTLTLN